MIDGYVEGIEFIRLMNCSAFIKSGEGPVCYGEVPADISP
jgi:hypothetical protein